MSKIIDNKGVHQTLICDIISSFRLLTDFISLNLILFNLYQNHSAGPGCQGDSIACIGDNSDGR